MLPNVASPACILSQPIGCYVAHVPMIPEPEVELVGEILLRQVGGSIGATLPKDMADRLHLEAGDNVFAIETADGSLLTPYDRTSKRGLAAAALASAYAFGLSRAHAFSDGNKRTVFITMMVVQGLNGHELIATEAEVVDAMVAVADGSMSEPALAEWVSARLTALNL